jgi:restriction system protein
MTLRDQQKNPILEVILGTVRLPFTLAGAAAGGLISVGRRYKLAFALDKSGRQSPERAKVDTSGWTLELLKRVEWRRFEELCAAYFEALGFRTQASRNGERLAIGLYAAGSQSASTLVHCQAWNADTIGIRLLKGLRGAMTSGKLGEGVFVTSGKFTHEARDYAAKENIHVLDGAELLAKIADLAPEKSLGLLKLATKGEFMTPTCPSCEIKMTSRTSTRVGRKFWGCPNYPRCKQTFFGMINGPA